MLRRVSPVKTQQWKQRFERYRTSSLTVAQFCLAEGVSVPSFYQWKKKLARKVTDHVQPSASNQPTARQAKAARAVNRKPTFQSIQLVPPAIQQPVVTIRTPGGIKIEIVENLPMIQAVLEQLLCAPQQAGLAQGIATC
jgi:hypothetical protein